MKTRIHINMHAIRSNRLQLQEQPCDSQGNLIPLPPLQPPITVKDYKRNRKGFEAIIWATKGCDVARVVYRPHDPLPCGATCWIETDFAVSVDND